MQLSRLEATLSLCTLVRRLCHIPRICKCSPHLLLFRLLHFHLASNLETLYSDVELHTMVNKIQELYYLFPDSFSAKEILLELLFKDNCFLRG